MEGKFCDRRPFCAESDKTVVVTNCGRLWLYWRKDQLSTCLAGQAVHLARQLHGLRSRLYGVGGENFAVPGKPFRPKMLAMWSGPDNF